MVSIACLYSVTFIATDSAASEIGDCHDYVKSDRKTRKVLTDFDRGIAELSDACRSAAVCEASAAAALIVADDFRSFRHVHSYQRAAAGLRHSLAPFGRAVGTFNSKITG